MGKKASPGELKKEDLLEFFVQKKESGVAIKALLETAKYLEGDDAVAGPTGAPSQGWKWLMNQTQNKKGKIVFINPDESIPVSEHFIKPEAPKMEVDLSISADMTPFEAMSQDLQKKMSANFGTGTVSGKMSSSQPNLSNIPKSGSEPMKIGNLFKNGQAKKHWMPPLPDETDYYSQSMTNFELQALATNKSYNEGTKSGFELFKTMMKVEKSEPTLSETVEQLKAWQKSPAGKAVGDLVEVYARKWVDVGMALALFEEDEGESPRLIELCTKENPQPGHIKQGTEESPLWNHDEVTLHVNIKDQTVEFKCRHCKRRWAADKGEFTSLITADKAKVLRSLFTEEWE